MANSNGNTYPTIIISNEGQVFGIDSQQRAHQLSNQNFALDIGISEDGTIWVISNSPDPDGGGGRIFWSTGNGTWNEISTSDPGGVSISGGTGSSCYYITSDGTVRTLNTDGSSSVFDDTYNYLTFDYGGGYVWAVFSLKDGDRPQLFYSTANALSWNAFKGNPAPYSISTGYSGDCYGVDDNLNPVYYSKDGSSIGSAGSGVDGKALQISSKNWTYLVSTEIKTVSPSYGNMVYIWVDTQGGVFEAMSIVAVKVQSTYYLMG